MRTLKILMTVLASASVVGALEITPESYVFDRATDSASFNYADQTGRQLIDGAYGGAFVHYDLGNGAAYEWVAWNGLDKVINIDFTFDNIYTFNEVQVSSIQQGGLANIVLPSFSVFSSDTGASGTWNLLGSVSVPESLSNNGHRPVVLSGLNVDSQYLRVQLKHSLDGPWTFSDEIDFFGSNSQANRMAVPDGGSSLILLALATGGLSIFSKMRKN